MVNKRYALFTGLLRTSKRDVNQTLQEKIDLLKKYDIKIFFFSWKDDLSKEDCDKITNAGVNLRLLNAPIDDNGNVMRHVSKSIIGRQRQIYMAQKGIEIFDDDCKVLKLRWDIDFNEELLRNFTNDTYLEPIPNGMLKNKVWVSFFSIQELYSVSDQCYFGYKKDLEKIINFNYKINGVSANNFISHDGMHLMPAFIAKNQELCNLLKLDEPDIYSLMFKKDHLNCEHYIKAWAYSYYIYDKYFKTGPLGTCFFKKGDIHRWPFAIVDYDSFYENYESVISTKGRLNRLPRYRVYDDIFVKKLVNGHYNDTFAQSIYNTIRQNKKNWENFGV
mgnify:CR=1 FL=1